MIRSKSSRRSHFISEINITPFTDVCLVLLIIFMVTAPAMVKEHQFRMNMPRSTTADTAQPATVTVDITTDQQVYVNQRKSSFAELATAIADTHARTGADILVVRADENVPYRLIIKTVDVARKAGVAKVNLATIQQLSP
jgi:biopolymer transport protein ExbD